MNGRKKPRKPRVIACNVFDIVRSRVTKLMAHELAGIMDPYRAAFQALREGVATSPQVSLLDSAMLFAQAIEEQGVVRGIAAHLTAAQAALAAIRARATLPDGGWKPTALYYVELDDINAALDLHHWQLRELSAGEVNALHDKVVARIKSAGGVVETHDEGLPA